MDSYWCVNGISINIYMKTTVDELYKKEKSWNTENGFIRLERYST